MCKDALDLIGRYKYPVRFSRLSFFLYSSVARFDLQCDDPMIRFVALHYGSWCFLVTYEWQGMGELRVEVYERLRILDDSRFLERAVVGAKDDVSHLCSDALTDVST